ncbi:hypothetical protein GBA52_008699 [Prunus armeniaca]|nr:hypothetical protein GBA52_008699 [Prunus armeniaca]
MASYKFQGKTIIQCRTFEHSTTPPRPSVSARYLIMIEYVAIRLTTLKRKRCQIKQGKQNILLEVNLKFQHWSPAHGNGAHFVASCLPPLGELPQRKGLVTAVGGGHPWV